VWAILELLHEITPLRLAGGMLAIAGLFLSKMSAPLILPMAGLMVLVRLLAQQPLIVQWGGRERVLTLRRQQLAAALAVTLACGMFTYAAVWAYGFRYSAFAEGPLTDAQFYKLRDIPTACDVIPGRSGKVIAWMADKRILPEAYLYGTAFVVAHLRRVAFLNGQYSMDGWWYYFPYCFAVKTPLALAGVLGLAGLGLRRAPKSSVERAPPAGAVGGPWWYALMPLAILLVVFWASAMRSTFNIGYRHILPVYPALYILAGGAGRWLDPDKRGMRVAVIGMVGLFAIDSLAAYPHYLAFFNQFLPREQAYQHLVDSNLDWGQDLPGLKCWLDAHNSGPNRQHVFLAYWGKGNPAQEGIDAVALTQANHFHPGQKLGAGLYCVSASGLQAVFEDAPGHWNKAYEERYQARRRLLERLDSGESVAGADGKPLASSEVEIARRAYEYGQYLRVLAFLRHRRPDAMVGYSILIFDLTASELDQALTGPPPELDEQPWLPKRVNFL
jgi:hypothetical protein